MATIPLGFYWKYSIMMFRSLFLASLPTRATLLGAILALSSSVSCAQEEAGRATDIPEFRLAQTDDSAQTSQSEEPTPVETGRPKSYAIPALEILGFDTLVNLGNRWRNNGGDYSSNVTSARNNFHGGWKVDNDPYEVNQIGHPYQGSMYHGFARSAGLSYWEAAGYTFAGSVLWEVAGERTPPSLNDQIASGVAGSFFGEPLFRMASLVLEQGGGMTPYWREWAAAAISPSMGFNRNLMGYRSIFSSRDAPYYSRLSLGFSGATQNNAGTATRVKASEALADFSLDYGMPGKPGYEYTRPFDYFTFQGTASSANLIENVMTRGLLYGKSYEVGDNCRGISGIYGSFDYIAPQTYRISSTALSVGTTAQAWLSSDIALQGTGLLGAGYAAVGTLRGSAEGDYHYGVAPQALLALRLILRDRASLDVTGREYFVTGVAGANSGHDNIIRTDLAFTWRIRRDQAISIRYLWNRRDASYPTLGDRTQSRATVGIFYTLLGDERFGAVDWRQGNAD
ncbi:MAG: DUF3943 domain-containing protein [Georgfuchsia sp.]